MKLAPARLTLALAIAAVAGGLALSPGTAERLTMLVRDGRFETAMRLGDRALLAGDGNPQVLARLFDLNSHEGDPERASRAILAYLAERPHDVAMLRRAAAFFAQGEDLAALLTALQRLVAETQDPAAIEELARVYRIYGRFAEEQALLLTIGDAHLGPAMAIRAAGLLARKGDDARAATLLTNLPETALDDATRVLLFEVLVRSGRAGEATDRAVRWSAAGIDPGQQALFVLSLALAGARDDALRLAEARGPGGDDLASLVWMLGERGHVELAEAIVRDWLRTADDAIARRATRLYVDLALATGTTGRVVAELRALLISPDPAARRQAARLAAVLYERQGYALVAPVRPLLSADVLAGEPLFAAALSQIERNPMATRHFLLAADLDTLGDDDAALWSALAADTLSPTETADTLMARWHAGHLSEAMWPALQRAARRSSRFDPVWSILRRPSGARKPQA